MVSSPGFPLAQKSIESSRIYGDWKVTLAGIVSTLWSAVAGAN
jgi:hypothetical protein